MSKKIGSDHAKEMFKRGLDELRSAVYPADQSNIAQPNSPMRDDKSPQDTPAQDHDREIDR